MPRSCCRRSPCGTASARRSAVAVLTGGALCLPWFLAGPAAFLHDTMSLLVGFRPLPLTPNPYIWAHRHGFTPPFWVTGLILLAAVVGTAYVVRREQPSRARFVLWAAVLLLTANLANKQAFYNSSGWSGHWRCSPSRRDGRGSRSPRSRSARSSHCHSSSTQRRPRAPSRVAS